MRRLRFRCGPNEGDLALDLVRIGTTPAVLEPRHFYRNHARIANDTMRFTQTGAWTGRLRVGGESYDVDPQAWIGTRDRSWGIRSVGEAEPRGIRDALPAPGFFWLYSPMRFDDFAILTIINEDRDGERILEEAVRVWPEETGRAPEPLGRPTHEIEFVDGTRDPKRARLSFTGPADRPIRVEVEPLLPVHVALGCGYGNDHEWRHGMYQGKEVVQYRSYDLTDAEVRAEARGVTDYAARFELDDGRVGYGLFEFAILGPYGPYGFDSRSR
jgi:hypothetical protein